MTIECTPLSDDVSLLSRPLPHAGMAAADVLALALDLHAIVAITDRKGRILHVNDRFCAVSGYSRRQLLGQDHRILNSGHHPREYMRHMWRTILRGGVWHGEFCNRTRAGHLYWVQSTIVPVLGEDGRPERFVAIRTEVTAQKRAEAALAASEIQFQELFAQSADALLLLDAAGQRFIEANASAARMLGYDSPTALMQLSPEALSPERQEDGAHSADKAAQMIQQAIDCGSHRFEWLHCSERRPPFAVDVLLTAIKVEHRQLLLVTWRDISRRREQQRFDTATTATLGRIARNAELADCLAPLLEFATADRAGVGMAVLRKSRWHRGLEVASTCGLSAETARHLECVNDSQEPCALVDGTPCPPECPQQECRDHFVRLRDAGRLLIEPLNPSATVPGAALLIEVASGQAAVTTEQLCFRERWTDLLRLAVAQSAAREEQSLSTAVFEHGAEGMLISACDGGRVLLANAALGQLLRGSAADLSGRAAAELLGADALGAGAAHATTFEQAGRRLDGSAAVWRCVRTPLPTIGCNQALELWIVSDITTEREQRQRAEFLAFHDPLTGLPNRSLLQERLTDAVARADAEAGSIALLYFDLDRFKEVNDGCGHAIGDEVLQRLSQCLSADLRPDETLARMGGDEFMLLIPGGTAEIAEQRAHSLIALVRQPQHVAERSFTLGASCGISLYPADAFDAGELMKNADIAMYEAKSARGQIRTYSRELGTTLNRRLLLAERLKAALDDGRLKLYYQPQVCLVTGRLVGAEALLRWQERELGRISPAEFVDIAERCGLMIELGTWVIARAFSQWADWQTAGLPVPPRLSLNVSALQVTDPGFEHILETARIRHGIASCCIELELTESTLIADPDAAVALFDRLVEQGYTLAIDDFGTGYSSLVYLKQLPVSRLKIDRAFVRDMLDDPNDRTIVETVLAMARALKLGTVAEGAESEATIRLLRELGCDVAQGFHISRPLSPEAFAETWLRPDDGLPTN